MIVLYFDNSECESSGSLELSQHCLQLSGGEREDPELAGERFVAQGLVDLEMGSVIRWVAAQGGAAVDAAGAVAILLASFGAHSFGKSIERIRLL